MAEETLSKLHAAVRDVPDFPKTGIIFKDITPILKDGKTAIPDDAIRSVQKNYVALKGPLAVCYLLTRMI